MRRAQLSPLPQAHWLVGCVLFSLSAGAQRVGPAFRHVGCFRDADLGGGRRVIPSIEHSHAAVQGSYKGRANPVTSCAIAAEARGFPGFCVQDGGWCGASADIMSVYDSFGTAHELPPPYACRGDGAGGIWSNDVYELLGDADLDGEL